MPKVRNSLSSVTTSVDKAHGLPNEHYVSDEVFSKEKRSILFDSWAGIGFTSDVPAPGDVKPISFLGMPLLLVRDHEGTIKVFQNTCRHRGMILVQQPASIKKVVRCPYHSWCYALDGSLQATPHVGGPGCNVHESIKRDELGLHEIASSVWLGVVFVNVSGDADSFEKYNETLASRWHEFATLPLLGDPESTFTLDVKSNWKLAVENYCESYHLPWIHPGLNSYSRLQDHYNIEQRGAFSGQGSYVYRQLKDDDGHGFEDLGALSEAWDTGAEYIALYPNVLLGVHRDHTIAIVLEPVGINHTVEHIGFFYSEKCAKSEEFTSLRMKNRNLWKEVFIEDIGVVEGMQVGRSGYFFDGGKFSPAMDGPTHNFHNWVATKLSSDSVSVVDEKVG
ncbi:MAG: aromatic ring-hydroxylating dioxygenase subunit alpha [Granulosicoccus sp.]